MKKSNTSLLLPDITLPIIFLIGNHASSSFPSILDSGAFTNAIAKNIFIALGLEKNAKKLGQSLLTGFDGSSSKGKDYLVDVAFFEIPSRRRIVLKIALSVTDQMEDRIILGRPLLSKFTVLLGANNVLRFELNSAHPMDASK
jgi:hypothetical protein